MKDKPQISEAEWIIMQALWTKAPQTSNQIVEVVVKKKVWKDKTIKTLINRLVNKGIIGFKKEGKVYHYFPVLSEEECKKEERRSFLSRVYNGAAKSLLAAFIEEENLSQEEIQELARLLDNKKKGK